TDGAYHDRLHHALGLDRLRQFLECHRIDISTRLVFAALDQVERKMLQLAGIGLNSLLLHGGYVGAAEQGVQSTSQASFLGRHENSLCGYAAGSTTLAAR